MQQRQPQQNSLCSSSREKQSTLDQASAVILCCSWPTFVHGLSYPPLALRMLQVDSPADMLLAEQWAAQHGDEAAAPTTSPTNRHLASQHEPSGPSMSMTFPASGSAPQRHLLFTPPPRPQLPPAPHTAARLDKRRKLPEQANATWGLDVLDQGRVPLDSVYHYTYNGTQGLEQCRGFTWQHVFAGSGGGCYCGVCEQTAGIKHLACCCWDAG